MGNSGRRMAREHALQVLYSYEMTANPIQQVIENLPGEELSDENSAEFAKNLIHKAIENTSELDKRIKEKALNWEFSRIAILDRLILRMGICELLLFEDIPPKVTINEAIEIAKKYSTEKSGIFVNGILDSILQDLRNSGDLHKIGRGLLDD